MLVEVTKISQEDLVLTLASLGFGEVSNISSKMVRGSLLVMFLYQGQKISRFVSPTLVKRFHVERLIDRSKVVKFDRKGLSATQHRVSKDFCNCPAFGQVKVSGKPVCKHTIAYAKLYLGCANFSEMIAS